jgi:hypothetical protein
VWRRNIRDQVQSSSFSRRVEFKVDVSVEMLNFADLEIYDVRK